MIQRIQTIWLLLASACGFATLYTSFYIGSVGNLPLEHFTAMSNVFILILSIITATIALVSIFLFKQRSLQMKLVLVALALVVLNITLYFINIRKFTAGGYDIQSAVVFAIPIFLILAIRGIWKDDQLVKSTDRLR